MKFKIWITSIWFICISCFYFNPITAQNPQLHFRHYGPDDGLPSSEVYDILEDQEGYIWISTDNGVSRFNGYEFENFGPEQGLTNNVVFQLEIDSLGRVWMSSLGGDFFIWNKGEIQPYKFNYLIEQGAKDEYSFFIDPALSLHIAIQGVGVQVIDKQGNSKLISDSLTGRWNLFFKKSNSLTFFLSFDFLSREKDFNFFNSRKDSIKFCFYNNANIKDTVFYTPIKESVFGTYPSTIKVDGYNLLFYNKMLRCYRNSKLLWETSSPCVNVGTLNTTNDSKIIIGDKNKKGTTIFNSLKDLRKFQPSLVLLPNLLASQYFQDKNRGCWIGTNEDGIYYCSSFDNIIYNPEADIPSNPITTIAVKDYYSIYLGFKNGKILLLNANSKKVVDISRPKQNTDQLRDLIIDDKSKSMIISEYGLLYEKKNNDINFFQEWNKRTQEFKQSSGKKIRLNNKTNSLFICASQGFLIANRKERVIRYQYGAILDPTKRKMVRVRTLDIYQDFSKNIWLGRADGLVQFIEMDTSFIRETSHPAFSLRIEAIEQLTDSTLVVGTKGGGVVFWKNDQYDEIKEDDGLTASMIENIHIDSAQNIWVGTLNGLNKIVKDEKEAFKFKVVKRYTIANGLPSNEVTDIDSYGDQLWVATTKGLVNLVDEPVDTINEAIPFLEKVWLADKRIDPDSVQDFSHTENYLKINLLSINYRLAGKINYRYRLKSEEDFKETMNRSIVLASLQSGKYQFEAQAQNEDGYWSESSYWYFEIHPPWWQTGWFMALAGLAGVGLIWYVNRSEVRRLRKEAKLNEEIQALRATALAAQMNPHFVSNCLASIQGYVSEGEKDKAIRFLARFGRLIRKVLDYSDQSFIPLSLEQEMMEDYLSLEKMRFQGKFDFRIDFTNCDMEGEIPPLLVQPYVENAVLHAFVDRETGGGIAVNYHQTNDQLLVTVMDNGIGISASKRRKANNGSSHVSKAMSITERRIGILMKDTKQEGVQVEEVLGDDGQVAGTMVSIRLPIQSEWGE